MQGAGRFEPRAGGLPGRRLGCSHEQLPDPVAAMRFVGNDGRDSAPGATVMGDRDKEVGHSPDQRPGVVGDEHIGSRIGEHVFKPTAQHVGSLLMAQLIKQASELIGILEPSERRLQSSRPEYERAYRCGLSSRIDVLPAAAHEAAGEGEEGSVDVVAGRPRARAGRWCRGCCIQWPV